MGPAELFAMSIAFTVIHLTEEILGPGGPLWDYFGQIVRVKLPFIVGVLTFTVALFALQAVMSYYAYFSEGIIWASVLLGFRVSDSIISHWYHAASNRWPNPGIWSTLLYMAEAAILFGIVGLDVDILGFSYGFIFFGSVLPLLLLVRKVMPAWREENQ